ncbi:DEKNAAC100218 [Brettanomyces naardenensis]|uniref:DEKNAAC100218 n=1 Tax=Brettanomyces naardenensis TaxID=13370 RepID=A0A448YEY7_BRENA|nr:DEKNAAC100218 [Brettanomyces naardenensis]
MNRIMLRPSQANDENVDPNPKGKSQQISERGQRDQIDGLTEQSTRRNRARRALGVISDSTLNSRTSEQKRSIFQDPRSKIAVLKETEEGEDEDEEQSGNEVIDDEDIVDEEDDYSQDFDFSPMSPIMNQEIYNDIEKAYKKYSMNSLDPNDEDTYDITMVAEYGAQIFNYMHKLEIEFAPNPRYMEDVQSELLWEHRATLMDWLVQLHSRFNLLPETLYLAVNVIDRFLSKQAISLSRFQLCGAVALFIAAKYEEINVPTVSQMIYMVGNQFSAAEFLKAERFMVEALGFEFGYPGPMSFLRRGSKADDYDSEIRTVAKYFLEITIMDPRLVASPVSWLAAGAQYTSRKMLGRGSWTDAHVYYSGYTADQLAPLYDMLVDCCLKYKTHHKAIFDKYSERRFKRSSIYVQEYLRTYYSTD